MYNEAIKSNPNKSQLINPNHLVGMKNTSCYWQTLEVSGKQKNW